MSLLITYTNIFQTIQIQTLECLEISINELTPLSKKTAQMINAPTLHFSFCPVDQGAKLNCPLL